MSESNEIEDKWNYTSGLMLESVTECELLFWENLLICSTVIHRFTSVSWKLILPLDFKTKPGWTHPGKLCEVDASCHNMLTVWGHYWFRLIPPYVHDYLCLTLYKPLFTKDNRMYQKAQSNSDQQLTLIQANPANDRVCQSRVSWWHLIFWDGKDIFCQKGCPAVYR